MKAEFKLFCKAVAAGTLAGGGPYLLFTVPLAFGDQFRPIDGKLNILRDLYLALLPVLVALVIVLFGSLVIGIPTAAILGRGAGKVGRYVLVGVTTGFMIPLLGLLLAGAEWGPAVGMGMFGILGGGVTALTWANAMRRQNASRGASQSSVE